MQRILHFSDLIFLRDNTTWQFLIYCVHHAAGLVIINLMHLMEKMMAVNSDISELFERYTSVENEIQLLKEDKKQLFAEFKDRIDPKAFRSALQSAKIKAKLKPEEVQDFGQVLHILEKELSIEHIA